MMKPANRRRYHGLQNIPVELRCCVRMVNIRNAMNTIVEGGLSVSVKSLSSLVCYSAEPPSVSCRMTASGVSRRGEMLTAQPRAHMARSWPVGHPTSSGIKLVSYSSRQSVPFWNGAGDKRSMELCCNRSLVEVCCPCIWPL